MSAPMGFTAKDARSPSALTRVRMPRPTSGRTSWPRREPPAFLWLPMVVADEQIDLFALRLVGPHAQASISNEDASVLVQGGALRLGVRRGLDDTHYLVAFNARQPSAKHLNQP